MAQQADIAQRVVFAQSGSPQNGDVDVAVGNSLLACVKERVGDGLGEVVGFLFGNTYPLGVDAVGFGFGLYSGRAIVTGWFPMIWELSQSA